MRLLILFLFALLSSTAVRATNCPKCHNWDLKPYVGIEAHVRYIDLESRFGKPLFKRTLSQFGIYGGYPLNDYIGIELGFETTFNRTYHRTLLANEFFPGSRIKLPIGHFELYTLSQYVDSINLGVITCMPVISEYNWIFMVIGVSHTKIRSSFVFLGSYYVENPDEETVFENSRSFDQEQLIPFIKIGTQHKIAPNTIVRIFVDWKKTERFRIKSLKWERDISQINYQNTMGCGVGLIYLW